MREEVSEGVEAEKILQAALDTGVLSSSNCRAVETKEPGKLIAQADGLDIVKKASTRKGRCLMLLACQISLVPGGQLGELECMDTQTPFLYMTFPGGRFRLEGTFAYPKSRYTVLKLGSRQNVQLEHAFEHIIVFSKMTWVGSEEDNPNEKPLPVPEELKTFPEGDSRGTVLFGQGLGAESVTVRGSGQGAAATPSKPRRGQPARCSRGKAARVVDSDDFGEDEEDADGGNRDDISLAAEDDGPAEKTPPKPSTAAAGKDAKKQPVNRRRAEGKGEDQAGTTGPESKRKRKSPEQSEPVDTSPPAAKRRPSGRAANQPKYAEESEEEDSQLAEDGRSDAHDSDYSASE